MLEEQFADGDAADVHVFFVPVVALAEDAYGVFPFCDLSLYIGFAIDDSRARPSAAQEFMAGHSCTATVLAFEDRGLATIHGDADGVTHVRLGECG